MGIPSCLDPRYRLAIPDTPPELVTPDSASYSSRHSEERSWNPVAPISPPMSNYEPATKTSDMSSVKGPDETETRRDVSTAPSQAAPRQQLPSLSSLFGPPSQVRPLHSPMSDRPGSYASTSPLDRPHVSAASSSLERTYSSSSYFPPTTAAPRPASQPRSTFEPRIEERPQFPSLSRAFPGPLSPHAPREPEPQRPESRSDLSTGSRWPMQHEANREYALGSRESYQTYRPAQDRLPPQHSSGPSREGDAPAPYREQRTPQTSTQNLPSTPGSTTALDGLPAKDGLGPKIWTGTHFLPRFVRAAEVPGEGMCYFYDDGSHCKTVIDGEAVNAHWGVTKAGKPRKRLAIACVTCREKKIKCDPDYPRCVQCEKFGRVCKFKNAPRGGHNTSPSTPPAEVDDTRRFGGSIIRPPPDHTRPGSHSGESISPRTIVRPPSPDTLSGGPPKRMRIGYEQQQHYVPTGGPPSPMPPMPETARPPPTLWWHQQPEMPRIHEDVLCRAWQTDPYVSDPQSVTSTISSFFVHTDATALRFLPEKAFKSWVQNISAHRKSPEDLMLVYSILAVGVALSGSSSKNIAREYAQVARYATERAALSLQLVQARILLSLYYLAVSRPGDANDMSSAAIYAATCLQLNLELDRSQDRVLAAFPYGLTRAGYAECRRRTFWSCFILERLNGLFPTRINIINPEDIFIRLPADVRAFEDQVEVGTPAFEPLLFSSFVQQHQKQQKQKQPGMGMGIMGYLVQVVAIWGDVMAAIYRGAHREAQAYDVFDFGKFHQRVMSRLEDWKMSLPPRFIFSPARLGDRDVITREEQGSLILMHLIYHLTLVKLHRHAHPQSLTLRYQYSCTAQEHARKLLEVVCAVAKESSTGRSSMPPPYTSFAILEAIDVLSAEGNLADLPGLVDGLALARSVLEILGVVWEDARVHQMAMDHRLDRLANLRDRAAPGIGMEEMMAAISNEGITLFRNPEYNREKRLAAGPCWQMADALEPRFPREMDCVYGGLTDTNSTNTNTNVPPPVYAATAPR
ncbi:hypothetical protein QBC46DRAFT_134689 [Diplogelasinospora grovesii]|uniref:Zn(2)-C6 fungal-type domain-containing protein n=1 Tax=Diplogelasinospora grovesii TaxID=303347 RepID=A0AAN6S8P1_9PEZI|nr:hypothetical protein QBC46DRAFT_134689 [Diplogelasinospora grovesii]